MYRNNPWKFEIARSILTIFKQKSNLSRTNVQKYRLTDGRTYPNYRKSSLLILIIGQERLLFVYFYQNEDYRLSQGLHKQLSILNTLYSFNECYSVIHSSVRKKWHGRRFALPLSSHDLICLIPIFIIRFRNYIHSHFSFFLNVWLQTASLLMDIIFHVSFIQLSTFIKKNKLKKNYLTYKIIQ